MKSIFVGNLAWSVTDDDLQQKFSEFGNVSAVRIVKDRLSGKSRGFGFVDMEDTDAEKAIAGMNGFSWDNREITVNEARPRND